MKYILKLTVDGRTWQQWTIYGEEEAWDTYNKFALFDDEVLELWHGAAVLATKECERTQM